MNLAGRKLGILIAADPDQAAFHHGINLAREALSQQLGVYLYCIDRAVRGLESEEIRGLTRQGLKLHACALATRERDLMMYEEVVYSGLTVVSDLIACTDRFVSFT